jgi:hypothetical protein
MKPPNNAMHLSRHRKVVFSAEHTLRPGDGERWAALLLCKMRRDIFGIKRK